MTLAYQPEAVLAATDAAKLCFGVGVAHPWDGLRRRVTRWLVKPPVLEPFKKGHSEYPLPWEPKTFIFGGYNPYIGGN